MGINSLWEVIGRGDLVALAKLSIPATPDDIRRAVATKVPPSTVVIDLTD
jgi:hypothetical protein